MLRLCSPLKPPLNPLGVLKWNKGENVCQWQGVRQCLNGRVSKLVVETVNLTGTLDGDHLNQLDQIRVLSFTQNSIWGQIPDLSGLRNLKSIYLNNNRLSGGIPVSLAGMHRLKIVVLSGNLLSGSILPSFASLSRLFVLFLQDNRLSGPIPPFNQSSLKFFNISGNDLSGEIPTTPSLARFNASSFRRNMELCGELLSKPCESGPAASPAYPSDPSRHHTNRKRIILISVLCGVGFIMICVVLAVVWIVCLRKKSNGKENGSLNAHVYILNQCG